MAHPGRAVGTLAARVGAAGLPPSSGCSLRSAAGWFLFQMDIRFGAIILVFFAIQTLMSTRETAPPVRPPPAATEPSIRAARIRPDRATRSASRTKPSAPSAMAGPTWECSRSGSSGSRRTTRNAASANGTAARNTVLVESAKAWMTPTRTASGSWAMTPGLEVRSAPAEIGAGQVASDVGGHLAREYRPEQGGAEGPAKAPEEGRGGGGNAQVPRLDRVLNGQHQHLHHKTEAGPEDQHVDRGNRKRGPDSHRRQQEQRQGRQQRSR